MAWLCSNRTQAHIRPGQSARTFRAQTAWCWNVEPFIEPTGEIFDEIQLDGIYLQHGHCCLIAYANGCVVDFQWCTTENSAAWGALLARIPAPAVGCVSSTTNRIEGGVNAPLRQMLLSHRGMRLERRKRAVEWWLQQHTDTPEPVHTFIQPHHHDPNARVQPIIEEPIGPALYDRAFSTEEGIGIQHGWKGL